MTDLTLMEAVKITILFLMLFCFGASCDFSYKTRKIYDALYWALLIVCWIIALTT